MERQHLERGQLVGVADRERERLGDRRIRRQGPAAAGDGTLYAGGGFTDLENIDAADNVAYLPPGGPWRPLGAGAGPCDCAVTTFVRGLTVVGTDAYVGTDANDIAGIPQADHVARWNGSAWSAPGRRQRRRRRVVPCEHLDQRSDRHRQPPVRHRDVPERQWRRERRQRRLLRRHRMDRAGNLDATPAVKRFTISKR